MSLLQAFKGHRGEYLVALQFVLMFVFILAPNWNPLATPGVLAALEPARWIALGGAGLVALVFGAFGSMHIRDYLTPLPYPVDHSQLVKHGVYAWVRHPPYALGWTLYTLSLTHLLILAVGFVFFDYKARKEEAWLTERHPEYADYAREVRKFVPWIY